MNYKRILYSENNSYLNNLLFYIRNKYYQNDKQKFRINIKKISQILAYEISKDLNYNAITFNTPLTECTKVIMNEDIVIISILRAGLAMHEGFLEIFELAENAYVAASRKYINETDFEIVMSYFKHPDLESKTIIIVDPMLATGSTVIKVLEEISIYNPKKVIFASIISSIVGNKLLLSKFNNLSIYTCDEDENLNDHSYIIPGLGDAGDLLYGIKIN